MMKKLLKTLKQRNRDWAVQLALEAQAERGQLVEPFEALGNSFGPDLGKRRALRLRVIDGGREA